MSRIAKKISSTEFIAELLRYRARLRDLTSRCPDLDELGPVRQDCLDFLSNSGDHIYSLMNEYSLLDND